MWIHQRTGQNSAVSFRLGSVLLGLFAVVVLGSLMWSALQNADFTVWILVTVAFGLLGLLVRWLRSLDSDEREYRQLAAMEQRTDRESDLERLRSKYRD